MVASHGAAALGFIVVILGSPLAWRVDAPVVCCFKVIGALVSGIAHFDGVGFKSVAVEICLGDAEGLNLEEV